MGAVGDGDRLVAFEDPVSGSGVPVPAGSEEGLQILGLLADGLVGCWGGEVKMEER